MSGWLSKFRTEVQFLCWLLIPLPVFGQASLFDSSFAVGPGANDAVNGIVVQNDGRIVVGGEFTTICGQPNAYLARLLTNGTVDASFNVAPDGPVNCLLQQSDGNVLIGGKFTSLQGMARSSLARLLTNGVVDTDFDVSSALETNEFVFTMALQSDGKLLVASYHEIGMGYEARLRRFKQNGDVDDSFITNYFDYMVRTLLPRTNGTTLIGGAFQTVNGIQHCGLVLVDSNGRVDESFEPNLTNDSNIFSLVEKTNGAILVGGTFVRQSATNRLLLARLKPNLEWDDAFVPDEFDLDYSGNLISALFEQPDGSIVIGGEFYTVGGYYRRHLARLNFQGRIDPCFDPGMGLGGFFDGPVRCFALQPDGRMLVGGMFFVLDAGGNPTQPNVIRALPQSDCDATRTYLGKDENGLVYFAAGTCPPGGTNLLQMSTNLLDWETVDTQITPYVFWEFVASDYPAAFFRVKKEF